MKSAAMKQQDVYYKDLFLKKHFILDWEQWCRPLVLTLRRERQAEFKAGLVYIGNSKPDMATQ